MMKHIPDRGSQPDDRVVFAALLDAGPLPSKDLLRVIAMRRRVRAFLGTELVQSLYMERCRGVGGHMLRNRTKAAGLGHIIQP